MARGVEAGQQASVWGTFLYSLVCNCPTALGTKCSHHLQMRKPQLTVAQSAIQGVV